jgi:hypothetical protein
MPPPVARTPCHSTMTRCIIFERDIAPVPRRSQCACALVRLVRRVDHVALPTSRARETQVFHRHPNVFQRYNNAGPLSRHVFHCRDCASNGAVLQVCISLLSLSLDALQLCKILQFACAFRFTSCGRVQPPESTFIKIEAFNHLRYSYSVFDYSSAVV